MKKLLFAAAAVGLILVMQPADPVQADNGEKTIICHLTNGLSGHVIEVSDNAVKAHCRHGLGDHNPQSTNSQTGNACGRGTLVANVCAKGCLNDDRSECRD